MLRVLLTALLPLVLPAVTYAVVARLRGRPPTEGPWFWLFLGGVGLTLVTLVVVGLDSGAAPGERYVPARMEEGGVAPPESLPPDAVTRPRAPAP